MSDYNLMAKCISTKCEKRDTCGRAMSNHSAVVNYLGIDSDEFSCYYEVKLEIQESEDTIG